MRIVADIKILIERIKRLNVINGSAIKSPTKSELNNNHVQSFRRAVYFNKNMREGEIVKRDDLISLRPNKGVDAREFNNIVGMKLIKNVNKLQELNYNMFE